MTFMNELLVVAMVCCLLACMASGRVSADYERALEMRRREYLEWVIQRFGELEPTMHPRDARRWALNHARLALNRDLEKTNRYFESDVVEALPRDADIYFVRFLKTLLDFRDSPRLSEKAKERIIGVLKRWPKQPITTEARWPPFHTENHDLMHLTIGLFAEMYRGGDVKSIVQELKQSLAWRFERGWIEWNSKCYQFHYSNPLIILADYAPDENLRRGAEALLNVLLAERARLSVNGFLGGPSFRCRTADANNSLTARKVAYLMDARYDGFLPTVWLAFGIGEPRFDFENARVPGLEPATIHYASGNEPRLKQDKGMFFACSRIVPHPIVVALAREAKTRKELVYRGRRFLGWPSSDPLWKTQKWLPADICYYVTPHVSMGSVHSDGWICQARYNSVLFGADPSQGLRVEIILPDVPPHKRRYEARGRCVQHKNWLLAQGTLFEDSGIRSTKVGRWNIYQVGKGLCAHIELPDSYHVLQVSDLDLYPSVEAFVSALTVPEKRGNRVFGTTTDGDRIVVNLEDMSITINDVPRMHPPEMLHDCMAMRSRYGSGRITITTGAGSVTFDSSQLLWPLPELHEGEFRWGNPVSRGSLTKVAHVRALGGMLPNREGVVLKSVSMFIARNHSGQIRLAVYVGGTLEGGPHTGTPARLLYDFGKTPKGAVDWVTLEHPDGGVPLPANTPIWLAWKGEDGKVWVKYQDEAIFGGDFQRARGRWESKAISPDPDEPWPTVWTNADSGAFADYWYSCWVSFAAKGHK